MCRCLRQKPVQAAFRHCLGQWTLKPVALAVRESSGRLRQAPARRLRFLHLGRGWPNDWRIAVFVDSNNPSNRRARPRALPANPELCFIWLILLGWRRRAAAHDVRCPRNAEVLLNYCAVHYNLAKGKFCVLALSERRCSEIGRASYRE